MAVRTDEVQLKVEFITDESRALAQTLNQTKQYNNEIQAAAARIKAYQAELAKANTTEQRRAELLANVAKQEKIVADNLTKIAAEGKKVEALDLSKVTPAQLLERAKQLQQTISRIPQSAPEFGRLQNELAAINTKMKEIRDTSRGIQAQGAADSGGQTGGFFGSIIGKATVAIAAIQAVFSTLQGLFNFAVTAVQDFNAGEKADAALADRIRSTGEAAGRTLEQLNEQATNLSRQVLFDDDTIKKGQELLLTFTNIREEIFDRTVPAALDLSTVFGQDVSASAVQLGKALNDPVAGITALSRVGITFSDEQKKQVAQFVELNDVASAQALILAEVEKQVGGAAQAAAQAGTGPYTLLRQRFEEVRGELGKLIAQGLQRLQPVAQAVIEILAKLVDVFTQNKAATGEYAGVVNTIAVVLKAIGGAISLQFKVWSAIGDAIGGVVTKIREFIQDANKIPAVAKVFEIIAAPARLLFDAIFNAQATWAGFVAGVQQGAELLRVGFQRIVLEAQAFAKRIELTLTISGDARTRVQNELSSIEAQAAAARAGKTIGQAYTEARNAAIAEQEKNAPVAGPKGPGKRDPLSVGGLDEEELEKRRKKAEGERQKAFDTALKQIEANERREELLAEAARIRKETTEQQYQQRLSDIAEQAQLARLEVYKRFGKAQEAAALEIQNNILRVQTAGATPGIPTLPSAVLPGGVQSQTAGTDRGLSAAADQNAIQEQILREKFRQALITEQDYEMMRLELKAQMLQREIDIMRTATVEQTDEIKKREEQKRDIEQEIADQRAENERRLADLRIEANQQAVGAFGDSVNLAIQLLGKDEAAKKRYATVIKAFEIGQAIARGIGEVQAIFAKFAAIPGGQALAFPEALRAGIRTAAAVARIAATKFARGGYTGPGYGGRDETGFRPAGIVHEGEYVVPKWMVRSAGPVVSWLESRRLRGYADGGLVTANTTPSLPTVTAAGAAPVSVDQFNRSVNRFAAIVAQFPTEVKSRVVYTELEDRAAEIGTIREEAAF